MNRKNFLKSAGFAIAGIPSLLNAQMLETVAPESKPIGSNANRDWNSIAKEFSINRDITFMNNGTMGINPKIVLKSLQSEFEKVAFRGTYPSDFNRLKKALGKVVNAPYTSLAITKNVTEGLNIACFGNELKRDDEVIMTTHEHVGGCAAWLYRAKTEGIRIKTFPLGMTAAETLENLKQAITLKTKIIAIPHIPCTIGQIMPIKEICKVAREKGIVSIVDGAHPLGMIRFDIADIDCDYYAGCLHKWLLAPLGMGYIYINPNKLNATKVHNVGAYSLNKFDMTAEIPLMDDADLVNETQRFSTGTFCGPIYEASIKAIEWYESIGIDRIEQRVKSLSLYTQNGLEKFKGDVKILSPREDISRGAQTAFTFIKKDAQKFIEFAAKSKHRFTLRHVHEGKLNAVRVSTHYYNNESQINALMETLDAYLES